MANYINRVVYRVLSLVLVGLVAWQRWSIRRSGEDIEDDEISEFIAGDTDTDLIDQSPETDPRFEGHEIDIETTWTGGRK